MIVVDATVALAWVLEDTDEAHRYSADVAAQALRGVDTLYLALAMALGAKLATLDAWLRSAARSAGVPIFKLTA